MQHEQPVDAIDAYHSSLSQRERTEESFLTPAATNPNDGYQLQTLTRGASVLNLLLDRDAFTLAEASNALGLGTTITYRLLRTWLSSGYLQYDPDTKRYSAGLSLMRLAAKTRATAGIPEAEERLRALARHIDQTCSCAVLAGRYSLYVARVLANRSLTYHVEVGKTLPAAATSTGHVLLAAEPPERIDELYPEPTLPRFTDTTPATRDELRLRLDRVRADGFALNRGQLSQSICAVAVPVYDPQGRVVAAFSIAGPASEMPDEAVFERYLPALREAAREPLHIGVANDR